MRVIRQVNSLWQVLPHKAAGVLICSTLPGILRVAKEHLDICSQSESLVISHFLASVPGERLIEFTWELSGMFDQSIDQIGRAPCRERVCQYVSISVGVVSLKKK